MREATAALLGADDPRLEIAGLARDGREAVALAESGARPDVVLLDLNMPVMSGIEAPVLQSARACRAPRC